MTATAGPQTFRAPAGPFVPAYRVIVPLVLVKDTEGFVHHCYQDALLEWLSDEQEMRFLDEGFVERISAK
jgi:hypothetical protein